MFKYVDDARVHPFEEYDRNVIAACRKGTQLPMVLMNRTYDFPRHIHSTVKVRLFGSSYEQSPD